MVVVSNRIRVAKGQEEAFEKRFAGRLGYVERHRGFVRFELLKPIQSDSYVVLTYWETEQDFLAWTESEDFKEAHRNRPPKEMFAGPNVFELHEIIQHSERPESTRLSLEQ